MKPTCLIDFDETLSIPLEAVTAIKRYDGKTYIHTLDGKLYEAGCDLAQAKALYNTALHQTITRLS